jgi:hypothetical protein
MPKQVSFMLLRVCIQLQLDYMLRALPPSVMLPFAIDFDATVLNTAIEILDLWDVRASDQPAHKLAMEQLYIPIAAGGLGLRRTVDTCHVAFLSAHISAIKDQPGIWSDINEQYAESYSALLKVITEYVNSVRNSIVPLPLDDSDEDTKFREKHREKMDKLLIPWPPDDMNVLCNACHTSIAFVVSDYCRLWPFLVMDDLNHSN